MSVGSSKSVEGEASRETGDGSEERLERLGEMMGDVVLVDLRKKREKTSLERRERRRRRKRKGTNLHHRREGLLSVRDRSLSTAGDDLFVVDHTEKRRKGREKKMRESADEGDRRKRTRGEDSR